MEENNKNFKEKFQAFWNVKKNRIATIAAGSVVAVGIVLAIALPIALGDSSNSGNTSGGDAPTSKPTDAELGKLPVIDATKKTITYGLYPQTIVSDAKITAALNDLDAGSADSNGWYLYNYEYYVKKKAYNEYGMDKFSDGRKIDNGTEYWFKCEPVEWKILANNDNTYSLVSTVSLDAHQYNGKGGVDGKYASNYSNSDIREWLNGAFYNAVFSLDSSYLLKTEVDNSASTTKSSTNLYVDDVNTNDYVYLLSYQDYMNESYGFSTDESRLCKPTDYALACNCYRFGGKYTFYCWTRSPGENNSTNVCRVEYDGSLGSGNVTDTYYGVRPSITIKYSA